jgi:hypothetical protein
MASQDEYLAREPWRSSRNRLEPASYIDTDGLLFPFQEVGMTGIRGSDAKLDHHPGRRVSELARPLGAQVYNGLKTCYMLARDKTLGASWKSNREKREESKRHRGSPSTRRSESLPLFRSFVQQAVVSSCAW